VVEADITASTLDNTMNGPGSQGKIVMEAKVASEPEALVAFFEVLGFSVKQLGIEAASP
jgi:hypothetical protein